MNGASHRVIKRQCRVLLLVRNTEMKHFLRDQAHMPVQGFQQMKFNMMNCGTVPE